MHIGILDGVRATAVLGVAWFHIWQQSWLDASLSISGFHLDFNWIPRSGFLFVDVLILLSGFCLFLPYARHMVEGLPYPKTKSFYLKRIARIIPSYWFCLFFILFVFVLPNDEFNGDARALWKDLLTHLSFTQVFWQETYHWTKLNVVLWTLAIEVQFYLIFPAIAWAFVRQPIVSYFVMVAAASIFRELIMPKDHAQLSMWFNQLPNFLDVYANGMLGALAYVRLARLVSQEEENAYPLLYTLGTAVFAFCLYLLMKQLSYVSGLDEINAWQTSKRFAYSILFISFIISAGFSYSWLQTVLSNAATRFISLISYNFFIWHQYLAVKMKTWHIPASISQTPNFSGEVEWQHKYTLFAFAGSFLLATLLTYCLEKPVTGILQKRWNIAS